MAGTRAGFSAAAKRAKFRSVMEMGMPTDPAQQLTWRWNRVVGFVPDDPAGHPYDWTAPPVVDVAGNPDDADGALVVPYALEVLASNATAATSVGTLDFTRALVTLMDEDYEKVRDADYVTIGTMRYSIDTIPPHVGLFDLTVVQVVITAMGRA